MHANNTDYGPSWLDEYADRLSSSDQQLEAVAFRQMAEKWNADQAALHTAQTEASQLQQRLDRVASLARTPDTASSAAPAH